MMQSFDCLVAVSAVLWSVNVATCSSLTLDSAAASPVSKVVLLLQDMLKQLEKDASDDEEVYDKMACWCQTNEKEKAGATADAKAKIEDLTTKIEELTANSARLNTEITKLQKEVTKNKDALDKAISIRQHELEEFTAEEKDLLASISALQAAVAALSKHNAASFFQMPHSHMLGVATTLHHEMQKHAFLLMGLLTPSQRGAAVSFIQAPSYAPQSGVIFGILKQMKESFESNLSESQKEEMANQKAYEDLKAAKEEEIAAGQAQLDKKTEELADTDEKNAQAQEDIEDTKISLGADEQFLLTLKEKCQTTDGEWKERQKARQLEMEAMSKALAVLSGDGAHKAFIAAFVQKESTMHSRGRVQASKVLAVAAERLRSPRLAALSYRVRLDAFARVRKAMDDMVVQLMREKADEIKHHDFCVNEFKKNALLAKTKENEKKDLIAKIEGLEMTIKALTEGMDALKAQIAEMQVQIKRAGEDREKENKEFQMTVADQREMQKLLQAALSILAEFYDKKAAAAALVQQEQEPAPPGFTVYHQAAAGGVMGMIKQIISDAKATEAEAVRSEQDAQKAFEEFVKETNASIEAKSKEMVNKSEEKAKSEGELVETKESKEAVKLNIDELSNYDATLHQSCDFIMNNFEARQAARDEEVEALKQAKAILSGNKITALLRRA